MEIKKNSLSCHASVSTICFLGIGSMLMYFEGFYLWLSHFLGYSHNIAMASPLATPKGFKFYRFFSRLNPRAPSTSQVCPFNTIVPSIAEGSEQPTTLIGKKTPKESLIMMKIVNSYSFVVFFRWAKPIYKGRGIN